VEKCYKTENSDAVRRSGTRVCMANGKKRNRDFVGGGRKGEQGRLGVGETVMGSEICRKGVTGILSW
jgi:hypothetical protein